MCSIAFCRIFTPLVKDAPQGAKGHKADIEGGWLLFFFLRFVTRLEVEVKRDMKWKTRTRSIFAEQISVQTVDSSVYWTGLLLCKEHSLLMSYFVFPIMCFRGYLVDIFANNQRTRRNQTKTKTSEIHPDVRRQMLCDFGTEGAPRIPMIYDNHHNPIPSIPTYIYSTEDVLSSLEDDLRWPRMTWDDHLRPSKAI